MMSPSSCMVSITMAISGTARWISRVASTPSRMGMVTSISTTSGKRS